MSKSVVGAAVVLLALAVYANSLGNGFVWDDPIILTRQLPLFGSPAAVLMPPPQIPQFAPDYYRPLVIGSYLMDRALGGGAPWVFHLTVVLAHALATLAVFALGLRLFPRAGGASADRTLPASAVAAACFAVHPVHSEAVAWAAGRADVFAGLFAVLSVYAHCRSSREPRFAYAAGISLFLALLAKEVAASAVLLLVALDWLLPDGAPASAPEAAAPRAQRRRGSSARVEPARGTTAPFARYAPPALAVLVYGALRWAAVGGGLATTSGEEMGSLPAMLLGALGFYAGRLVAPVSLNAYIAELPTGPGALALCALATLTFAGALALAVRRRWTMVVFLLAWIAITLAPSLTILFKIPEVPVAERYLYLPSVGFCLLLGWVVAVPLTAAGGARRGAAALVIALLLVAAAHTAARNRVWADDLALWSDTAPKSASASLPLRALGGALFERGDLEGAVRAYEQALARRNDDRGKVTIYSNLGTIALTRGDLDRAEDLYRRALAVQPTPDPLYNLGVIALQRAERARAAGDREAARAQAATALAELTRAESGIPLDPDVQLAMAQALDFLDRGGEARARYERALALGLSGPRAEQVRARLSGS